MSRRKIGWVFFALWALIYINSIIILVDFGADTRTLERGLNRLAGFVGWQIGAGIVAIIVWWSGRFFVKNAVFRWIFRVPTLLLLALVVLVAGLVVWGVFNVHRLRKIHSHPFPRRCKLFHRSIIETLVCYEPR